MLFSAEDLPRTRKRRVMMRVIDSGTGCESEPGEQHCILECPKCGARSDWESFPSISAAKRGKPCHNCNKEVI